MQLTLSDVRIDDAERLVRECDFPAMKDNPLHRLMFPSSCDESEEEEIKWEIEGLQDTLRTRLVDFRKVCLEDGTPVGFAGWSLEQETVEERKEPTKVRTHYNRPPSTLDIQSWREASRMLGKEKKRVLHGHQNIWRLNMISVNPKYQCQGVGSTLLEWGCKEADSHKRDSFLIASPAGLRLYAKFGFKTVGTVQTSTGTFTSMFRDAQ
ncbi:acyl-CoA N-acyltransferase [Annulohypoxylon moriforme]|nr:acyl-CoA N-acyltransferase [Annulohypoxylon moriforme]